jgi:AcrR family transcriptional regulator
LSPAAAERSLVRRAKTPVLPPSAATDSDLANRERIVVAGRVVFARDGFYGARIIDVAAEACVGIGTLYRHFRSKADIFAAVIGVVIDEIYEGGSFSRSVDATPIQRIDAANRSYLNLYFTSASLMATLNHLATQDEMFRSIFTEQRQRSVDRLRHAIERWQEAGEANVALDPAVAAEALIAMMVDVAFVAYNVGGNGPAAVDVDTINDLWVGALGLSR